jgi:hypothetical protein
MVISFISFCQTIIIILLYEIAGFPGAAGYNIAHPPSAPPPIGYSFHPLSQPAVSAQPPQGMAPGFQMFGKHHSIFKYYHIWCIDMCMQVFQVLLAIQPLPLVPLHLTLDTVSHLLVLNFLDQ